MLSFESDAHVVDWGSSMAVRKEPGSAIMVRVAGAREAMKLVRLR